MPTTSELCQLLVKVQFNSRLNCIEGLDSFRTMLERDLDHSVRSFLNGQLPELEGKRQAGVAFALAEHYRLTGDIQRLEQLYAHNNPEVKQYVLNASWGAPGDHPEMGAAIVRMAMDGMQHPSPEVRTEACSVIQNQAGWKVDVSPTVAPLLCLLEDESDRVRMQAACAVGNLARRKYELSAFVAPLGHNVRHKDILVRNYSAWALWQMSRNKINIQDAVPELVQQLTDNDDSRAARKNAVGALIHFASRSPQNREQVRSCLQKVVLDPECKQIQKLLLSVTEPG
jgi:HEAT repeats